MTSGLGGNTPLASSRCTENFEASIGSFRRPCLGLSEEDLARVMIQSRNAASTDKTTSSPRGGCFSRGMNESADVASKKDVGGSCNSIVLELMGGLPKAVDRYPLNFGRCKILLYNI